MHFTVAAVFAKSDPPKCQFLRRIAKWGTAVAMHNVSSASRSRRPAMTMTRVCQNKIRAVAAAAVFALASTLFGSAAAAIQIPSGDQPSDALWINFDSVSAAISPPPPYAVVSQFADF